jgi:integrase
MERRNREAEGEGDSTKGERPMTRLHLKYVQSFGGYHYFRRRGSPRIPLPGIVGSAEFMEAYQQALAAAPVTIGASLRSKPGSVSAAIAGYYGSQAFRALAPSSQLMRRQILEHFRDDYGTKHFGLMPPKFISLVLDQMAPFAARNWLKAIRAVCQFAVTQGMCKSDPTADIKLPRAKAGGHHTWTEDEIAQFEAHHPVGSKAHLALALLLCTAQRRGDVIRMGRQHIRDGVLTVRQEKTGVALRLPVHPVLAAAIEATPSGNMPFLTTETGKPYKGSNFSLWFRARCTEAGLPMRCTAHGLRKAACRRLAEAGASVNEIAAVSGHRSLNEIARYTRAVDQEKMARSAMARGNASATSECQNDFPAVSKPLKSLAKKSG